MKKKKCPYLLLSKVLNLLMKTAAVYGIFKGLGALIEKYD